MNVFHFSMECYPVAKVGGLADVVGALPKYQNMINGVTASVVMPFYHRPFVHDHEWDVIYNGEMYMASDALPIEVYKERAGSLGFDLYLIRIPHVLDRENPYGYADEHYQFLAFQQAAIQWIAQADLAVDVIHCHDYHTGLIPFFINHCPEFEKLRGKKTVGTIHNGEYQGAMPWDMLRYFPWVRNDAPMGLLEWDGVINPLAALLKCAHVFNTVSKGYLQELFHHFRGLESLVRQEFAKAYGIINGIDTDVWNPQTDGYITHHYNRENAQYQKWQNKRDLCQQYHLNPDLPLFSFIGRFATEKGADLLPEITRRAIRETQGCLNIMILGSGNPALEAELTAMNAEFVNLGIDLGYKEYLSHQIYAASDFLLMPSRVEPCGLNQLYAMRYGTVPIVRYTGGLRDTVEDISTGGAGINFGAATAEDAVHAIHRALHIYHNKSLMTELVKNNMTFDFSWEKSAEKYVHLYHK